ncbi:MAG: dTDP-4-dehydrorhamnose reductase [Candidatus Omnitrophota bacterium]
MKILLIGKTGQLGNDILKNNAKHEIFAPDRDELDLNNSTAIINIITKVKPQIVINTAAFHNVCLCEKEYDQALRINCLAVRDLALTCKEIGSSLITFSSDYVFNGKKMSPYFEDDTLSPLQIYGITRAAGEYIALSIAPENTIIIRTCGLYGITGGKSKGGNFVDKRINEAKINKKIEISCEQIVSPTYTFDLSLAVFKLIENQKLKCGIYHLVNEGMCNWYEFTKAIYKIMGLNVDLIPVNRYGLDNGMRRPLYSALANTKAKRMGIVLPHWEDAIKRYLQEKYLSHAQ